MKKNLLFFIFAFVNISLAMAKTAIVATTFILGGINYEVIAPNSVKVIAFDNGEGGPPPFGKTAKTSVVESNVHSGTVTIPATVTDNSITYDVTAIGDNAFSNSRNLLKVILPVSITSIGQSSFSSCGSLRSVNIPASVASIGNSSFSGCYALQQVNCDVTSPIVINANVFNIPLANVTLIVPNASISLYKSADVWKNFGTITDMVHTVNGVSYVITSSNSVKLIANSGTKYTGSITIPNSVLIGCCIYTVTDISIGAFNQCYDLLEYICNIETPLVIEQSLFYNINSFTGTRLIVPTASLAAYKSATIWKNFESIIDSTPFTVDALSYEITAPNEVKLVTNVNNKYSGSITIPASVDYNSTNYIITAISKSAFYQCYNLNQYKCNISTPLVINPSLFDNVDDLSLARLIVPTASIDAYKNTAVWEDFGTITDVEPFTVNGLVYEITSPTTVRVVENLIDSYTGSITIPSTVINNSIIYDVTAIKPTSFKYNEAITSVTIIGDKITAIDDETFVGCSGITSFTIPNSVTSIGESAFSETGITSITIPSNVTFIGEYAFSYLGLTSIVLPSSITTIGNGTFSGCQNLTSITFNGTVTSIGNYAFNRTGFSSFDIPNTVTSVGRSAFDSCENLSSVTIPSSVMSIGESAFSGCSQLEKIVIPNSVTSLGDYAFSSSGLTSIVIPSSITSIPYACFSSCEDLRSVMIPSTVNEIKDYAFNNCRKLVLVTCDIVSPLPIRYVFSNSYNATLVVPTVSLSDYRMTDEWKEFKIITDSAPFVVNGITYEITSASTVKVRSSIGNQYSGSVSIPENVTYNSIIYSVTAIGNEAFYECYNLTSISIGSSVSTIGDYAFYNTGLTSVVIPNSVTTISEGAFNSCEDLGSLTIGEQVTTIQDYAFAGNENLTSVISLMTTALTISSTVFQYVDQSNCSLTVPTTSLVTYQAAAVWKDFSPITGSSTLGINDLNRNNSVSIYPNPVQNELFVSSKNIDKTTVQVIDINGNVVIQKTLSSSVNSVDTSILVKGMYLIKLNSNEGIVIQKVIKN
ncbi:leucine-rich repeat protein [Flavobacterium ovatum]|uniref:leucine-rich repeat domain-containing protein n=1 Tax=Flavobacterium ovatum TaxID=1928857 RepID=UPI00344DED08